MFLIYPIFEKIDVYEMLNEEMNLKYFGSNLVHMAQVR